MSDVVGASCLCGNAPRIHTSWTKENPERRFLTCAKIAGGCHFFEWEDGPMCARSGAIIPGLLLQLNKLDEEKARLERRNKIYVVLISVLLFVILFMWIQ
ncbi:hypothetical protein CDL12_00027 [Handroanthus impetiginosus]|uniref:GRF-type domain-containing protein n=1 Tax=Handroanthus impetiginosus TaxID=429701 RepID=A0A2G9IBU0_9LAMI|nr:hypothetical protein CDL12_00027 [Handroanthus impetiginosus]